MTQCDSDGCEERAQYEGGAQTYYCADHQDLCDERGCESPVYWWEGGVGYCFTHDPRGNDGPW